MIWFSCKACGKKHSRADADVGLTLFCECGQNLRVPWSSTTEPEELPPTQSLPPRSYEAIPLEVEEVPEEDSPGAIPLPRSRPVLLNEEGEGDEERFPRSPARKLPPEPPRGESLPSRKKRTIKRANPAYCFNHDEENSQTLCEDCKLSFCDSCVVEFQARTLCGPCKNFRLRPRAVSGQLSSWAMIALVLGFVAGPLGFCLSTLPLTAYLQGQGSVGLTILVCLFALIPSLVACWVGQRALRQFDREPLLLGRGLAFTGVLAGLSSGLWCLTVAGITLFKQAQG